MQCILGIEEHGDYYICKRCEIKSTFFDEDVKICCCKKEDYQKLSRCEEWKNK
jgi:hypothetical protein